MQDKNFIRFIFRNGPSDLLIRKPAALLYASGVSKIIFLFTPITTGNIFSNQEDYLRVFLSDGHIPMDNNYAEQAIRPFTIGRKNFVLIESSNGAKASAILYSLVETAKANMINTFEYFNLLLTEIPQHMDDKDLRFLDDLLPWSPKVQKECPSKYKKS